MRQTKISNVCDYGIVIQLLTFRTLSIVLIFYVRTFRRLDSILDMRTETRVLSLKCFKIKIRIMDNVPKANIV